VRRRQACGGETRALDLILEFSDGKIHVTLYFLRKPHKTAQSQIVTPSLCAQREGPYQACKIDIADSDRGGAAIIFTGLPFHLKGEEQSIAAARA